MIKTKGRAIIGMTLAAVLALSGCSGTTGQTTGGSTENESKTQAAGGVDVIIVGGINDLSGDGSVLGNAVSNGAQLAVDEINAAGGILGKQLVYKAYDNRNDGTETINAYNRLTDIDKAVAIIGPPSSTICMSLIEVSSERKVPVLCLPSDPNVTVNAKTGEPYPGMFLVAQPNAIAQAQLMSDFMLKNKNKTKAAIFYDTANSYSTISAQAFEEAWTQIGGEVVSVQTFQTNDNDFKTQLSKIKQSDAEFIFLPNTTPYCVLIVQQAAQIGLELPYVGAMDMANPFLSLLDNPSICKEAYFEAVAWMQDENLDHFREQYKAKFGEEATVKSTSGYEQVYVLKAAIEANQSAEPEQIINALENKIKDLDLLTIKGYTQNGETHAPDNMEMVICEIHDGVLTELGSYKPTLFD